MVWSMRASAPTCPQSLQISLAWICSLAALSTGDGCFCLVLAASAQTLHSPTQGQKHSKRPERCEGKETPPGAVSSASYLLLFWVVEGSSGVQHSFLGIVEELRDVLEVLGRALGIQRKRQPCERGQAMVL